jgi:regulator of protease activity HflC (stomatin/prohibitin superfamily)
MSERIDRIARILRISAARITGRLARGAQGSRQTIIAMAIAGIGIYAVVSHPPLQSVERGEVGLRVNRLTGVVSEVDDGAVMIIPGLHELRRFSLRDQIYRPAAGQSASGAAPFQPVEGLSIGVDVSVRYVLDPSRIAGMARALPADIGREVVEPAAQSVLYKTLAGYTVREIFSTKRAAIQAAIEGELKLLLARDGIKLQGVMIGKIDLPADYKAGMERLLAEELASEKMRYTLELKDKQVKQTELEAQADKVRREKAAEAAAQSRLIEATGEAESRRRLADAEGYRQERLGKVASDQLARDGELISKHPLLIQKTMADKLSDKVSVIIAPPPANGGFIGSTLLGGGK